MRGRKHPSSRVTCAIIVPQISAVNHVLSAPLHIFVASYMDSPCMAVCVCVCVCVYNPQALQEPIQEISHSRSISSSFPLTSVDQRDRAAWILDRQDSGRQL